MSNARQKADKRQHQHANKKTTELAITKCLHSEFQWAKDDVGAVLGSNALL